MLKYVIQMDATSWKGGLFSGPVKLELCHCTYLLWIFAFAFRIFRSSIISDEWLLSCYAIASDFWINCFWVILCLVLRTCCNCSFFSIVVALRHWLIETSFRIKVLCPFPCDPYSTSFHCSIQLYRFARSWDGIDFFYFLYWPSYRKHQQ